MSKATKWLAKQWRGSLAASLWDDMTPLGRLTIWLPATLLCYAMFPVVIAMIPIFIFADWLEAHTPPLPPIFFRR